MSEHLPVLFDEVLQALDIKEDGIYLDGTFGRGGHSKGILSKLGDQGRLLVIDKDPEAIDAANKLAADDPRVHAIQGSFSELGDITKSQGLYGEIDGVLLDLGVSSPQLDDANRGFSFMRSGPLDMRMDPTSGQSAKQWLQTVTEDELSIVLKRYGEERHARRIARAIVAHRESHTIDTTTQLAQLIEKVAPNRKQKKHPATRVFQAIRIFLNRELEDLEQFLQSVTDVVNVGGRIAVISFHSLEDRLVKRFFRDKARGDIFLPDLPITHDTLKPEFKLIGKALRATEAEVMDNPRARSAILRVMEKMR